MFFKPLAVAALLALSAPAAFAEATSGSAVVSYQLENGLTVVLAPDHKVPKVSLNLQYRVGSLNEPPGRSGFAHLFEHLMLFAGTSAYPHIDQTFTAEGIDFNGFTQEDGTNYVAAGMSSGLPMMLSVYADQMANIGRFVDQSDLDLQRSVVLNEMRQNVLDAPAAAAGTALRTGMFPAGHPYSRAVIGSIADLEAATLDEVRAFFDTYYAPNNAVLVLTGDLDVAATQAMIEDTFGRIPRGIEVMLPVPTAFEPARIRIEATDAVAAPVVYLAFDGPDAGSADSDALYFASDLMSNETGILRQALVNTGIATDAGGFWSSGLLAGRFMVYASAGPNTSAEALEAALRDAVAAFVATPIDRGDMERSRSGMLISNRAQLEVLTTRSAYIALTMVTQGNVDNVLADDPRIVNTTAEGVEAAIAHVLKLDEASVAVVRPGPRGDYPAVLREASGESVTAAVPERAAVEVPMLPAGEPKAARLPAKQTATLSNGIEVVHYRMDGAPLVYVAANFAGGTNNDPRGKEGLYGLALGVAYRGAGDRDLEALARAAKDIGASVNAGAGTMLSGATLSVPPDAFAAGVDLLADIVQRPRFDAKEWDVSKAGMLNYLMQRDSDSNSVAQRTLSTLVFHPQPEDSDVVMTVASVSSLTLEEAATAYEEMVTPKTMTIRTVGDMALEDVVAELEKHFGSSWQDDDPGLVAKPALPVVFPAERQVYVVPVPGTSQATIHIARPAPGADEPDYPSAVAVTNLLAADFTGRLNSVIREQKGYSYGVSGMLWNWYDTESAMTVTIPVQIDATGPALQEALAGFDSLISSPVTAAEVTRSVGAYHTMLASLPETAGGFFGAIISMQESGIELEETIAYAERMTRLGLGDVQAEAARLAPLDRAIIVIAGDADRILPQLSEMGITEVETLPIPGQPKTPTPAAPAS